MRAILETVAGNPENQDRGAVIDSYAGLVLAVADGAGGRSGGAEAAALAVELVREKAHELHDADACAGLLQSMDQIIAKDSIAGETTCALAVVSEAQIYGASVGDSGVWVIRESGITDLTQGQSRKPFVGSGTAWAIRFAYPRTGPGHLLLATDGLLKYTSPEHIAATCRDDTAKAARSLIELVRYPSGALPDDVTVILVRI
jgi:serine/threonine protein phosphatase PrpC